MDGKVTDGVAAYLHAGQDRPCELVDQPPTEQELKAAVLDILATCNRNAAELGARRHGV